jgi:hypothetical protein
MNVVLAGRVAARCAPLAEHDPPCSDLCSNLGAVGCRLTPLCAGSSRGRWPPEGLPTRRAANRPSGFCSASPRARSRFSSLASRLGEHRVTTDYAGSAASRSAARPRCARSAGPRCRPNWRPKDGTDLSGRQGSGVPQPRSRRRWPDSRSMEGPVVGDCSNLRPGAARDSFTPCRRAAPTPHRSFVATSSARPGSTGSVDRAPVFRNDPEPRGIPVAARRMVGRSCVTNRREALTHGRPVWSPRPCRANDEPDPPLAGRCRSQQMRHAAPVSASLSRPGSRFCLTSEREEVPS